MQIYFVHRPGIAAGARELHAALTRLRSFEEKPSGLPVRWLHSYALREARGRFGLACLFEAESASDLRRHAGSIRLQAAEILPVTGMQVVRALAPTLVFLVRRRNAWQTFDEHDRSIAASYRFDAEGTAGGVRWLRSYAVCEDEGNRGSVCLYQSASVQALREHATRLGVPASEITPVIGRIVYRAELDQPCVTSAVALA